MLQKFGFLFSKEFIAVLTLVSFTILFFACGIYYLLKKKTKKVFILIIALESFIIALAIYLLLKEVRTSQVIPPPQSKHSQASPSNKNLSHQEQSIFVPRDLYDAFQDEVITINLKESKNSSFSTAMISFFKGEQLRTIDHFKEALEQYKDALKNNQGNKSIKAACYLAIGEIYRRLNDYKQALAYYHKSLHIYKETSDYYGQARCWKGIGLTQHHLGQHVASKVSYANAYSFYKECHHLAGQASILSIYGEEEKVNGLLSAAAVFYEKSYHIFNSINDKFGVAYCFRGMSHIAFLYKDYYQAKQYAELSANLFLNLNQYRNYGKLMRDLGNIELKLGHYAKAESYFDKSLELSARYENKRNLYKTYINYAMLDMKRASYQAALKKLKEAEQFFKVKIDYFWLMKIKQQLARHAFKTENYGLAKQYLLSFLEASNMLKDKVYQAKAYYALGKYAFFMMDYNLSEQYAKEALNFCEQIGHKVGQGQIYLRLALIEYYAKNNFLRAKELAHKSLKYFQAENYNKGQAKVYEVLGNIHRIAGDYTQSLQYYRQAQAIYTVCNNLAGLSYALTGEGSVMFSKGSTHSALELYNRALQYAQQIKDEKYILRATLKLAENYLYLNQFNVAQQMVKKISPLLAKEKNANEQIWGYFFLGITYVYSNQLEEAKKLLPQMKQIREKFKLSTVHKCLIDNYDGILSFSRSNYRSFNESFLHAEKCFTDINANYYLDKLSYHYGSLLYYSGDYLDAKKILEHYCSTLESRNDTDMLMKVYSLLGKIELALGNLSAVETYYEKLNRFVTTSEEGRHAHQYFECISFLALYNCLHGNKKEALHLMDQGVALAERHGYIFYYFVFQLDRMKYLKKDDDLVRYYKNLEKLYKEAVENQLHYFEYATLLELSTLQIKLKKMNLYKQQYINYFEKLKQHSFTKDNPTAQAKILQLRGSQAYHQGDLMKAKSYYEKALEIHRAQQNYTLMALDLLKLARIVTPDHNHQYLHMLLEQALGYTRQASNMILEIKILELEAKIIKKGLQASLSSYYTKKAQYLIEMLKEKGIDYSQAVRFY